MVMAHADQGDRNVDEIGKLLRAVIMDQSKLKRLKEHADRVVQHRDKRRELLKSRERMQQLARSFRDAKACGDDTTAASAAEEVQKIFNVAFPLACDMLRSARDATRR